MKSDSTESSTLLPYGKGSPFTEEDTEQDSFRSKTTNGKTGKE